MTRRPDLAMKMRKEIRESLTRLQRVTLGREECDARKKAEKGFASADKDEKWMSQYWLGYTHGIGKAAEAIRVLARQYEDEP